MLSVHLSGVGGGAAERQVGDEAKGREMEGIGGRGALLGVAGVRPDKGVEGRRVRKEGEGMKEGDGLSRLAFKENVLIRSLD